MTTVVIGVAVAVLCVLMICAFVMGSRANNRQVELARRGLGGNTGHPGQSPYVLAAGRGDQGHGQDPDPPNVIDTDGAGDGSLGFLP